MFRSGFLVSGINLFSRFLGLIREMLMAYYFGSTGATDAYFASSRIANLFTTMLGEGSLGTVFIPIYSNLREYEGTDKANEFLYSLVGVLFQLTLTIGIIMAVFSRFILKYIIGFKVGARMELANSMLKIMAFYIIFIALSGIATSLLNNYKKFLISTSVAIVFNITIILGIIISNKTIGIYGMAYAFLISGFLQLAIQLPSFFRIVKKFRINFNWSNKSVKLFFITMVPSIIGIFGYQINELVDTNFASLLKVGTISAINYASRLYLLPIGVFAVSLSVVIFPHLNDAVVKKNKEMETRLFSKGINLLVFLIVPCMFGLFFYARDIIELIFGYGRFSKSSIIMTSQILMCYALGLLFFGSIHILTRTHYAHMNRKIPVISSFIAIAINVFLDYMLYKPYAHIGLTLATTFSAMVNYLILMYSVKKHYLDFSILKYLWFILKVAVASAICTVVSLQFGHVLTKMLSFVIVYILIWGYPLYKKRLALF